MTGLLRLAVALALVALWALLSRVTDGNIVPSPAATAVAAVDLVQSGQLPRAMAQTLSVYLVGYAAAAAGGVAMGLVLGGVPRLGLVMEPYVFALTATPRVAFIPLIIVLLGLGLEAKAMIVFLGAVMPILVNTYSGVRAPDEDLVEMARSAGAGPLQIFRHVLLPGALPFIVTGLRLGATIGLINTIVAELYTAVQGLGGLLAIYGNSFRMAPYFVVVLTLAALGALVAHLLRLAETRMTQWRSISN